MTVRSSAATLLLSLEIQPHVIKLPPFDIQRALGEIVNEFGEAFSYSDDLDMIRAIGKHAFAGEQHAPGSSATAQIQTL